MAETRLSLVLLVPALSTPMSVVCPLKSAGTQLWREVASQVMSVKDVVRVSSAQVNVEEEPKTFKSISAGPPPLSAANA